MPMNILPVTLKTAVTCDLRNVTLSYDVPASFSKRIGLNHLSVNLSADNLKTWTKFTGMDPDVPLYNTSYLLPGISSFKYPINRQFIAGIEIRF